MCSLGWVSSCAFGVVTCSPEKSPFYGWSVFQETRGRLSEDQLGARHPSSFEVATESSMVACRTCSALRRERHPRVHSNTRDEGSFPEGSANQTPCPGSTASTKDRPSAGTGASRGTPRPGRSETLPGPPALRSGPVGGPFLTIDNRRVSPSRKDTPRGPD